MPEAWDISDDIILTMMNAYYGTYLNGTNVTVHLYKNDYTPIPGSNLGDYTEADFNGYEDVQISAGEWTSPVLVDHVAVTVNNVTASFTYLAGPGSAQQIYGYYLTDGDDNYMWGGRFGTTRTMNPNDVLNVTPEFRHRTYPYS